MNETFAIHPNVVAYMCAKRLVPYEDYKKILVKFFGGTARILWHDKVYAMLAETSAKCRIFPAEIDCKRVSYSDFMQLCEWVAAASTAPCVAEGIYNWALTSLADCILVLPITSVQTKSEKEF